LYFPATKVEVPHIEKIKFKVRELSLEGWVVNGKRDRALIYYGGNAERIENNIAFFQSLLPEYTVYLIPYRGYANNPGSPSEQALLEDASAIYDTLATQHSEISLMGRSLGTGVAIYIAVHKPVEKLILATPYDSIENVARETYWMFPLRFLLKDKFLSWKRAPELQTETLLLVAGRDRVVSRQRSDNLLRHIPAALVEEVVIEKANHNDISLYPQFSRAIREMLL